MVHNISMQRYKLENQSLGQKLISFQGKEIEYSPHILFLLFLYLGNLMLYNFDILFFKYNNLSLKYQMFKQTDFLNCFRKAVNFVNSPLAKFTLIETHKKITTVY